MRGSAWPSWKAVGLGAALSVGAAVVIGGLFVFSGIYNAAASREHFGITNALIRLTLTRSIVARSTSVEVPDLSDERLAALGARHFLSACAPCHASPVAEQNPVVAKMYPAPPALSQAAEEWSDAELFWIVKHGLKFTGMPAWPALERDDEVWALVAFLKHLPEAEEEDYARLTGHEESGQQPDLEFGSSPEATQDYCDSCHGGSDAAPVHPLAPSLAGQKEAYLMRALEEYADGRRPSGMMQPIAAALSREELARLAAHYAGERGLGEPPGSADASAVERGRQIARNGVRRNDFPACLACHDRATSAQFPILDGLSEKYIETQLLLFREGARDDSAHGAIMTVIAKRLNEQQIRDLAAYFASRPLHERGPNALSRSEAVP